jgi:ribosome-associated protein
MTWLEVNERIRIPEAEFEWSYARSSAPGGQNVNKVSSKAYLRFGLMSSPSVPLDVRDRFAAQFSSRLVEGGFVVITAEEHRDRLRNMDECREKLRKLLLAVAHPPRKRHKTKPTRGSKERRLSEKKAHSQTKKDRTRRDD